MSPKLIPSVRLEIEQWICQLSLSPDTLSCNDFSFFLFPFLSSLTQIKTLLNYHFLFKLCIVFGPDNLHFNQDTYQVPTIRQAINLIYSDPNRQIHIFIISGTGNIQKKRDYMKCYNLNWLNKHKYELTKVSEASRTSLQPNGSHFP